MYKKVMSIMVIVFAGLFMPLSGSDTLRPIFTPVDVTFRLLAAPRVKAGSNVMGGSGRLNMVNKRWGVIEIDFTPRYDFEKNSNKKRRRNYQSGVFWLNDVILGVTVIALDSTGSSRNTVACALFTGRSEFWSIRLDAKTHRAFMYLPPHLIERTMPLRRRDGLDCKVAAPTDFLVSVVFFHKTWGVIGQGFYGKLPRNRQFRTFNALQRTVPTRTTFIGSLLPRSASPWQYNDIEFYDLEKPAVIPPALDDAAIAKAAEEAEARNQESSKSDRKREKRQKKRNK